MVSGKRLFWPNINERCHTLFYWPAKFHWHSPLISRNQLKMTNFQNIPVIRVLPWNISSNCLNLKIQNFTWLHLFHFSPQCIIKCVPKALAWEDAKSHRLHLFVFSLLCLFIWALKELGSVHASRTGCICLSFLHCVFSNVSSNCLHEKMHNHTGCICLTFLQCVSSNVSSNYPPERMHNHTGRICSNFSPMCLFKCVFKALA